MKHLAGRKQNRKPDSWASILLTICNLRALQEAGGSARRMARTLSRAITEIDLDRMFLDIMNLAPSQVQEVQLPIAGTVLQRLQLVAERRGCGPDVLLNHALAKYLGRSIKNQQANQQMIFDLIALDPHTYEALKKVARRRRVSIQLLINSALDAYYNPGGPITSFGSTSAPSVPVQALQKPNPSSANSDFRVGGNT